MSTSIALVTCADVSSERRMCSAIPRRIADNGSSVSPGPAGCASWLGGVGAGGGGAAAAGAGVGGCCAGAAAGVGAGAGGEGAAGAGAGVAACASGCAPVSMKAWMSRFVTRPPVPVPGTWVGSMPCSDAIRATTGLTNDLPFPEASAGSGVAGGAGAAGADWPSLAAASASWAAGCVAGSGGVAAGAAAAAPSPPTRASSVPTATVSPSWTRISLTTPEAGEGTSVSTLSVEISSSVSSASTRSPTCLFHFVIVPSETETPICGMTTSTAVVLAISTKSTPRVRGRRRPPGE
jgi:hypothetical protein